MPRPKTYTWEKRIAVFLDYRLAGGKVNPVANRHAIARSTVRVIVMEFEDLGFSSRPRAKVSADLLKEMQELHLATLVDSSGSGVGYMDIGPGTSDEEGRRTALAGSWPVQEDFLWHIKGTKAEEVIQEAAIANRDYLLRESEAWNALRLTLEESCKLTERNDGDKEDLEPHLLPSLKSKLRNGFLEKRFLVEPPDPDWLDWGVEPDEPKALRLRGERVAIGSAADHQLVKEGMKIFLDDGFKVAQRRFFETEKLRQDMMLIQSVVGKAVEVVTADDIRRGICPACPYPEALLESALPQTRLDAKKERESNG